MSDTEFRVLLDRARQGDRQAQQALVTRVYPRVRQIVHRALDQDFRRKQPWIAPLFSTGDVLHEVLSQLAFDLGSFVGDDEETLIAYLSTAVQHRLLDALRFHGAARRDARRDVEFTDRGMSAAADSPATLASFAEQLERFEQVLDEFEPKHRRLLELRLVDDAPFQQIAETLDYSSSDTARQTFHAQHAKLLLRLRARGLRPPGETEVS